MAIAPIMVEISVIDAAKRLGLSERAVLYRIEQGKLKGRKRDQKWVVLWPDGAPQVAQAAEPKAPINSRPEERPRDDRRSGPVYQDRKPMERKQYTDFRELAAYRKLGEILTMLGGPGNAKDEAAANLRPVVNEAMERLAIGFYQWNPQRKTLVYNEARDMVARALHRLAARPLANQELGRRIFEILHQDVMGIMVALFKAIDRKVEKTQRAG